MSCSRELRTCARLAVLALLAGLLLTCPGSFAQDQSASSFTSASSTDGGSAQADASPGNADTSASQTGGSAMAATDRPQGDVSSASPPTDGPAAATVMAVNGPPVSADRSAQYEVGATQAPAANGTTQITPGASTASPALPAEAAGIPAAAGQLQLVGRWVDAANPSEARTVVSATSANVRASWSSSAVLGSFTGTTASCNLQDATDRGSFGSYVELFVDNMTAPAATWQMTGAPQDFPLGSGLSAGTHTFMFVKITEAMVNDIILNSCTGTFLAPPALPARSMVQVGDSISAGFGIECTASTMNPPNLYTYENSYLTSASDLAISFGASLTIIAESGAGASINADCSTNQTVPVLFPRALESVSTVYSNPNMDPPQLVLCNVNTNDFNCGNQPGQQFVQDYTTLVQEIRNMFGPSPAIIHQVGPMLQASTSDPISALLQQVINKFASMGDTKQSLFNFAYDDGSRGYGCNMHPNIATHQYMADQIRSTVANVTGWQ